MANYYQSQTEYPPGMYPPPDYYPAPGYMPQRGPGGLPTDRASFDVRAFIPAQYEHIRLDPTWIVVALGVGLGALLYSQRNKRDPKS